MKRIIAPLLLLLSSCTFSDECNNGYIKEIANKTKGSKVVLFEKMCGTSKLNSLQVSIEDSGHLFSNDDDANVFAAKSDGNVNSIDAQWIGNDTLIVRYNKALKPWLRKSEKKDKVILYELMD